MVKKEDEDAVEGLKSKRRSTVKKEEVNGTPSKKARAKKEEEEAEEIFKWWEQEVENDGSVKWQTLEHNGVIFPPPYEPLPSDIKMKYNGWVDIIHAWFAA
jgi:DNA topoisomerase-1